jgi:hypothetical protein
MPVVRVKDDIDMAGAPALASAAEQGSGNYTSSLVPVGHA